MTETDLGHVESKLGPLPAEYRRFLLAATPADRRDFPGVTYGVGALIKENLRIRRRPDEYKVIQPDGTAAPRPAGWVVVADNGGGDHWFVRAEDGGRAVWFWSHESWEARESSPTIAEAIADGRADREKYRRPTETVEHPTLGPVAFDGSSYHVREPLPVYVQVGWLHADPAGQRAVFDAAAKLIPKAVAGERAVLETALPRIVELQHQPMWWLPDAAKLTANQLREPLTRPSINVHADRAGDRFKLRLDFVYDGGEPFGWDMVDVETGPKLAVRDVSRLG